MTAVIISVMTITPESATYTQHQKDRSLKSVEHFGWALLAVILAMFLSSAKVVGHAVKLIAESAPLPIHLKIKGAAVSIWHGYVNLLDVTVPNVTYSSVPIFASPH